MTVRDAPPKHEFETEGSAYSGPISDCCAYQWTVTSLTSLGEMVVVDKTCGRLGEDDVHDVQGARDESGLLLTPMPFAWDSGLVETIDEDTRTAMALDGYDLSEGSNAEALVRALTIVGAVDPGSLWRALVSQHKLTRMRAAEGGISVASTPTADGTIQRRVISEDEVVAEGITFFQSWYPWFVRDVFRNQGWVMWDRTLVGGLQWDTMPEPCLYGVALVLADINGAMRVSALVDGVLRDTDNVAVSADRVGFVTSRSGRRWVSAAAGGDGEYA